MMSCAHFCIEYLMSDRQSVFHFVNINPVLIQPMFIKMCYWSVMRKLLLFCAIALLVLNPVISAAAPFGAFSGNRISHDNTTVINIASGNCAAKARSLAASYSGAQILSVKKNGNACIVVIRVNGKKGKPPRVIRKVITG